jgi:hypothetical protein
MRSGEEIRAALVKFVARWQTYTEPMSRPAGPPRNSWCSARFTASRSLEFRSFGGGLMVGVTRVLTWRCVILG